jgi:hypothetical protein
MGRMGDDLARGRVGHKLRGSVFFSEEKNQKTFDSAQAYKYGTWPERWKRRKT